MCICSQAYGAVNSVAFVELWWKAEVGLLDTMYALVIRENCCGAYQQNQLQLQARAAAYPVKIYVLYVFSPIILHNFIYILR